MYLQFKKTDTLNVFDILVTGTVGADEDTPTKVGTVTMETGYHPKAFQADLNYIEERVNEYD